MSDAGLRAFYRRVGESVPAALAGGMGIFSASRVSCFAFRWRRQLFCKASWSHNVRGAGLPLVAF